MGGLRFNVGPQGAGSQAPPVISTASQRQQIGQQAQSMRDKAAMLQQSLAGQLALKKFDFQTQREMAKVEQETRMAIARFDADRSDDRQDKENNLRVSLAQTQANATKSHNDRMGRAADRNAAAGEAAAAASAVNLKEGRTARKKFAEMDAAERKAASLARAEASKAEQIRLGIKAFDENREAKDAIKRANLEQKKLLLETDRKLRTEQSAQNFVGNVVGGKLQSGLFNMSNPQLFVQKGVDGPIFLNPEYIRGTQRFAIENGLSSQYQQALNTFMSQARAQLGDNFRGIAAGIPDPTNLADFTITSGNDLGAGPPVPF